MSAFNPSAQFSKRWLSTPIIAKQAFHQELDDIIALLKSDKPAKEFRFSHKDFNDDIAKLLHIYHTDITKPIAPDPTFADQSEQHAPDEMIYQKLSNQLDDFLSDQMAQLSEDLKGWLKNAIKEELSNLQQPQKEFS